MAASDSVPMKLVLSDGTQFSGQSFGALTEVRGEVVFNTAMTGYVETLTDPSYYGQILVLTYPLIGNYGVPKGPYEAGRIQVQGLVVSHYCDTPSHHQSIKTLSEWLKSEGVAAISGVDTRSLTRRLRSGGTTVGEMQIPSHVHTEPAAQINMRHVLDLMARREVERIGSGDVRVLVVDTGSKENIIRCLINRGAEVLRVPWYQNWEEHVPEVDGVFFTNGPGDPVHAAALIERVRALLTLDLPVFGICFGHQLVALAAGAKTSKMKYGHRSVNQPVQDVQTKRCYITSQNHGYVVQADALPEGFEPWFVNLNDGTNEGMRHRHKPIATVQFHPEACPGPRDTAFLFDEFLEQVRDFQRQRRAAPLVCQAAAQLANR